MEYISKAGPCPEVDEYGQVYPLKVFRNIFYHFSIGTPSKSHSKEDLFSNIPIKNWQFLAASIYYKEDLSQILRQPTILNVGQAPVKLQVNCMSLRPT